MALYKNLSKTRATAYVAIASIGNKWGASWCYKLKTETVETGQDRETGG